MTNKIILDNITFNKNPAPFLHNLSLEITFTALQAITVPIEWKIIYVGSAKTQEYDQTLQQFEIGPIAEASTMKFTVDCGCPDYTKIPADELICVTALIITITFKGQQFIRVGYYVHNVLEDEMKERELSVSDLTKYTKRTILTDKPRITNFKINWSEQRQNQQESIVDRARTQSMQNPSLSAAQKQQQQVEQQQKYETKEQKECYQKEIPKSEGQKSPSSQQLLLIQ